MGGNLQLHPKTAAAGVSGASGIVLVWLIGLAHVTVDPVVAGALVAVLSGVGAWLAPLIRREAPIASRLGVQLQPEEPAVAAAPVA